MQFWLFRCRIESNTLPRQPSTKVVDLHFQRISFGTAFVIEQCRKPQMLNGDQCATIRNLLLADFNLNNFVAVNRKGERLGHIDNWNDALLRAGRPKTPATITQR